MKKKISIISLVLICFCLFGCSLTNTPKKQVEILLMKYQNMEEPILSELNDYIETLSLEKDYVEPYKKIFLKQYEDLKYEIKDETIDGDNATVTVQIEVYDYYKVQNEINSYISNNPNEFNTNNIYDETKVMEYRLNKINDSKDRVTYTIIFNLIKTDDTWSVNNLTNEELEKIHGIYAH